MKSSGLSPSSPDILDKCGYAGYPTSDELALVTDSPETALVTLAARAEQSLRDAVPRNTREAYCGDLRRFSAWCSRTGLVSMPAEPGTVVLYMRALADQGRRVSTIERALAAISTDHSSGGYLSPWNHPLVGDMRVALRRELGTRQEKMRTADDDVLRQLLATLPGSLLGLRDRSLLTLGWCGALRRSELVALDVSDMTRAPKGLVVLVRVSKGYQAL